MNQFTRVSFVGMVSLVCVLLIGGPVSIAQLLDESSDKEVLVKLYQATQGDSWRSNDGWLSDAPISEWFGVTVRDDRVVELNLSYNNLSGDLPEELTRLIHLDTLDLRWNTLTGHLPDLGDLRKVTILLLTDNQFSGSIPVWIGDMEALQRLDLSHNQFKGEIPAEIGMLRSLRSLAIHHNNLSGPLPGQIGDAAALRRLILNDNALTGAIPEELGSLDFLRHLNLASNELSGEIPTWVSSSQTMEWMDLRDNAFDLDDTTVLRLRYALPDYDEYWGDQESSGQKSPQVSPNRELDPIVLNMWAQTSELLEDPAARAFIFELLKPLEVRDGSLHVSTERMRELVSKSNLDSVVPAVNAYLKETDTQITSANDLERIITYINNQKASRRTSTSGYLY